MNVKKSLMVFTFIGILLFVIGFTLPAIAEWSNFLLLGDVMGPIDDEYYVMCDTVEFGVETFKFFGVGAFVCGIVGLMFNKAVKKHCHIKTTVIAMYISADIGFGLFSLFMFIFGCHFFTTPENHPIMYPASIIFMVISLLIFCGLMYAYVKFRKEQKSFIGVLFDVLLSIAFIGGFFLMFYIVYFALAEVFNYYDFFEIIYKELLSAGLFLIPIVAIFLVMPAVAFLKNIKLIK